MVGLAIVALFRHLARWVVRVAWLAPVAPAASTKANLVRFHSPVIGKASAPVTIVEFFDPSCEACRAFYPYVKNILAEHPDDVRLVYAILCFIAGQRKSPACWKLRVSRTFTSKCLRRYWTRNQSGTTIPHVAKAWEAASGAGLDLDKARSDMQSPGIDAALKLDMQDVKAMGVRETPTFFVNGQSLSQFSPQALRKLVRDEIASAKK